MTFAARPNYAKPPAPAESNVFWDLAQSVGTWTLSESNTRAASPAAVSLGNNLTIYGGPGRNSGKRYYEFLCRFTSTNPSAIVFQDVGLGNTFFGLDNPFINSGAACARMQGQFYNNGNFGVGSFFASTSPIRFMVAVNFLTNKIFMGVNGSWYSPGGGAGSGNPVADTGEMYSGVDASFLHYPAMSVSDSLALDGTLLGNTSNIFYTPPTGFVVWGAP